MDNRDEVRDFLITRRAKVTPEEAGLQDFGGKRRVPGLRRGEVAHLAGVSIEYYTRLERGNLTGVSESVLEAVAGALQLDGAERAHLFNLARAATPTARARRRPEQRVRPGVQAALDAILNAPAFVRNGRMDVLATNLLAHALYAPMFDDPTRPVNLARFIFLDPQATTFYADWNRAACDVVAILRSEAGRDPHNRGLSDLVGELSTRSDDFATLWAAHDVRMHSTGRKQFHHPVVGDLDLNYEAMDLSADTGLSMLIYTAAPDTPNVDALRLLASWAATPHAESQTATATPAAAVWADPGGGPANATGGAT